MKTLRTKEDLLAVFLKGKLHPNNIFLYFAFILPFYPEPTFQHHLHKIYMTFYLLTETY